MVEFSSISLEEGAALLRHLTSEIIWRGRSLFLCAGCEDVLPNFKISLSTQSYSDLELPPFRSGVNRVALAFEEDESTRQWAATHNARLLMPSPESVLCLGDKVHLPEILSCAGLRQIPSTLFVAGADIKAESVWEEFNGGAVVVQRPENNLTGLGTKLVVNSQELARVFTEWGEKPLKVSQYLAGTPLTVSACVGPNLTIISAISRQLVGLPRLTNFWGAHCGNQLIAPSSLGEKVVALCLEAGERIGDELRRRGFLGVFGLDLLQTSKDIFVVEINPRLQSVSSLVNVVEIEAQMLPLPGVHLLSFLLPQLPPTVAVGAPLIPQLSQIVLYARRKGAVFHAPESGCYRLDHGTLRRTSSALKLRYLSDEEGLVWSFVTTGEEVKEDTRLCVLQTRFALAEIDTTGTLTVTALEWISALETLFRIGE